MKTCFTALSIVFVSCVAFAGEPTVAEPQSVLAPKASVEAAPAATCTNGTCCTSSSCRSASREGLFGRTVERTRKVTRAVVEVPVQVVAAPVRAVRVRRGCCNR